MSTLGREFEKVGYAGLNLFPSRTTDIASSSFLFEINKSGVGIFSARQIVANFNF